MKKIAALLLITSSILAVSCLKREKTADAEPVEVFTYLIGGIACR